MPQPKSVNPRNFKVIKIVYNLNNFSVAWGEWEDDSRVLAMRWNGGPNDAGYPKTFGNPVWFLLPRELSLPFLKTLQEFDSSLVNAEEG
ncbi:MAG: hypothetical protein NT105_00060 [Verrucomicrobia bacterium]|nr:hypothetical protein [Verrucomicrobiota bacterium]